MEEYLFAPACRLTPALTLWDTIINDPTQPWDFWKLSSHPELPWSTLFARFPHKGWNWRALSRHPGLDFNLVFAYPDKLWDWHALSEHQNLTPDIIRANPNHFWNFGLTPEIPLSILNKCPRYQNNWNSMTLHTPTETILQDRDKTWNWREVSLRADLPIHFVIQNPNLSWDWGHLSKRYAEFTMDEIMRLKHKAWNWSTITLHPEMSWEILAKHPCVSWNENHIRDNIPIVTSQDWKAFWSIPYNRFHNSVNYNKIFQGDDNHKIIHKLVQSNKWNWRKISNLIPWDIITPDAPLYWKKISRRLDLCWDTVFAHPDWPWDWHSLAAHPTLTYTLYTRKLHSLPWSPKSRSSLRRRFRHEAARILQKWFKYVLYCPDYKVCTRRLLREFSELTTHE